MCFGSKSPPPIIMPAPPPPPAPPTPPAPVQQAPQEKVEYVEQVVESPAQIVHPAGTIDPYQAEGGKRTNAMQKKAKKKGLNQFKIDLNEEGKEALTSPTLYPNSGINIPV